ncbi:MAG: acetone carboxylase, beta subunit, partial [Thermoleophilaceae bacterium]|nr:acetone carboxylase, beta subunit [Thermoleophilaceae bacterium]
MTDTILVDARGQFVVGKAQTTPADEAVGFSQSVVDALGYWGIEPDEAFASMVSGVYSGTSMLNRLLERKGGRIGLLVTRGMEDVLKLEQGIQTWLGFSYADTLHMVTHRHHEPLVPRSRIRGVGGRIDVGGNEVIPLYEDDAREGMRDLIGADLDCVCIDLLFSWRNPVHEQRTKEIALEVLREAGVDIPVLISSEVCPKRGELARLNTLVIDAYAAEPSRQQLQSVRDRTRQLGAGFDLRVMSSSGDTISIDAPQLVSTLVSGPIGGCVGARYLSEQLGEPNIACGDVGGTSFDVALVMDGQTEIRLDPDVAHFKLAVPMVRMDSVGAGTGTLVRINPVSRRIELGPDSAASKVGVSNPQADIETVSITDCDVVLGRIDPDYFLGGELKLDRDRAVAAVREQLAKPLALGVEAAAAGV